MNLDKLKMHVTRLNVLLYVIKVLWEPRKSPGASFQAEIYLFPCSFHMSLIGFDAFKRGT